MSTINKEEIQKFSDLAEEWWDVKGKFKPLHMFNPIRIEYIVENIKLHFNINNNKNNFLKNLNILDIGCGGGLISEPMSRLGGAVTGIDASEKNIKIAQLHAKKNNLNIRYLKKSPEQLNEFENRNHYIFSNSNNHISSTIFRINGNVSQTLGFQLYTEFFTNRNELSNYSELLVNYSLPVDTTQYILNNPYVSIVDPNVGLADDELLDPNYYLGLYTKFSELNTNFVITWNYNPGSNIYLVYSLNKNVNGRVFDNYIDFLRYNDPEEWQEILFDQSIYLL